MKNRVTKLVLPCWTAIRHFIIRLFGGINEVQAHEIAVAEEAQKATLRLRALTLDQRLDMKNVELNWWRENFGKQANEKAALAGAFKTTKRRK